MEPARQVKTPSPALPLGETPVTVKTPLVARLDGDEARPPVRRQARAGSEAAGEPDCVQPQKGHFPFADVPSGDCGRALTRSGSPPARRSLWARECTPIGSPALLVGDPVS